MNAVHRLVASLQVVVAVFFSASALAADPNASGARWACWYESSNLSIRCMLTRAPAANFETRAAEVSRSIDNRLPTLVKAIWGSPEKLAAHTISIPLWNVPFDMKFVAQLADSVMCGSRKECSVLFDSNPDGHAPVRVAALRSGASETDVMAELAAQGIVLATADLTVSEVADNSRSTRRRRSIAS